MIYKKYFSFNSPACNRSLNCTEWKVMLLFHIIQLPPHIQPQGFHTNHAFSHSKSDISDQGMPSFIKKIFEVTSQKIFYLMKDCFPNGFNCMQYLLIQSSGSFHIRATHWWVQTLLWVFLLLLLLLFLFSLLKSDSSSSHLFPIKIFPPVALVHKRVLNAFSGLGLHSFSLRNSQHANAEVRAKMRAAYERISQMADRFPERC